MTKGTLSNKILIQNLFSLKDLERIPFIPIVYLFGAKVNQISPGEMMGDATELTNSLLTCQELFGYDAVVNGFDVGLHHDIMGCPMPFSSENGMLPPTLLTEPPGEGFQIERIEGYLIAIESLRRLNQMVGKKLGLFGIATGPATLACFLGGKAVLEDPAGEDSRQLLERSIEICLRMSKTYGELQVDGMIFLEWALSFPALRSIESYSPLYQTLNNVIHFYNSRLIIALPHFDPRQLESFCQLKPDALLLGKWEGEGLSFSRMKELAELYQISFGIGIPFSSGREEMFGRLEWVTAGMEQEKMKRGIFLSSAGEIPYEMDVEDMHDFMERVKQIRL